MRTIALIGAGRVGVTISLCLEAKSDCRVISVVAHSSESIVSAKKHFPSANVVTQVSELATTDIIMVATPDDIITEVANDLWLHNKILRDTIVFHLSGGLSSSVLKKSGEIKGSFGSLHPSRSFPEIITEPERFEGTACAVEGDAEAINFLIETFQKLGAQLFKVESALKPLYHIASVFSNNFLNILGQVSCDLFQESGLNAELSYKLWSNLARSALENADRLGLESALTGPVQRGDDKLISCQREILLNLSPELGKLYDDFVKVAKTKRIPR